MKLKKIMIISLILILLFCLNLYGQENSKFKIIVNKDNPVESITLDELKRIFLKKQTKWENGDKIYPVDLNESSKTREYFTENIHGKRISSIKAYWQKQIFTGRGVPPPEKSSEKEVLEYVEKNEGAIGYIRSTKSTNKYDVKTISIGD